ncbi:hypothetical protein D8674_035220 [Pyrus ussuriensis x Pyrus communis]|uniref:Uncharacterized protein n=1 Tax=Pyrus ussuriensis x Pyrus communis TaxID=2448454 RepID=A0A5N5GQ70_9ROSA|nr:hypothetical protein D8674_035220 [Pyrus ussuriensis x Pyrus communis]
MEVKSSDKEWRRISSSTPPKRPLTPKPSTSDENDQYFQQVGNSSLQSPKKPLTKNYMSPTISAASKSKALASRKNILGERNEASQPDFSNTHVEKSQSPKKPLTKNYMSPTTSISAASKPKAIASRKNILRERNKASEPDFSNTHVEKSYIAIDNARDSLPQALPKTPSSFQSHDVDEALSDDFSSRPYDPVTNYLSPRPQFLRYKPNRRQELFLGLENGVGLRISTSGSFDYQKATDEEVGAVTSPGSLALPRPDESLKQEDEEVELRDSGSFDYQKATDEEVGAVTSPGSLALPRLDGSLKQEDEEVELRDSGSFDYEKASDEEVGAVTSPGSLSSPRPDGSLEQEVEEVEFIDSGSFDYQKATDEEVCAVTSPGSLASPHPDGSLKQEDEEVELIDSGSFDYQKGTDEEVLAVTSPGSLASPCPDGSLKQEDEEVELIDSGSFDYQKATDEEVRSVTSPGSLASPHPDGSLKQEVEEVELSDEAIEASDEEEYEEDEEEKSGKLKWGLKFFLLLLAIVLFSSYMSPMNHQTHFEGVEDAHCSIQNSTIEAALLKKLESGDNIWDQKEERCTGFVEVIKGAIEMEAEEVIVQGEETQIGEEIEDEAKVEDENMGDIELADEMREVVDLQAEEIEVEKEGGIDDLGEVVVVRQLEDIEEISGDIVENSELQGAGPFLFDDFDHQNLVSDVSNAFEGEVAAEQSDGIVEKKMDGAEESSTNMAAEPVMQETLDNNDTSFYEISDLKAERNWREELISFMKSKIFYTAATGVFIFSVIVASLVSVFRFNRRNATKKDSHTIASPSSTPLKLYSEPVIAERYNSVFPSRWDDSSFRRMSLYSKHSTGAVSGEYFHSQAPTVELLSELVVGGEVSSSLRSSDMKNKMTESEENNYSVSSKKLGSKARSVSIRAQPTESEFSSISMDSHSYGSFITPQKVMKKKEGGKDGEVTTPLRRSSRLRNRTVTSP